jgi:hypothetical protein
MKGADSIKALSSGAVSDGAHCGVCRVPSALEVTQVTGLIVADAETRHGDV